VHEDVPDVVHRFINGHWSDGWVLRIITGQSARMKKIVLDVVHMYDVEVEESLWNTGVLTVRISA